MEYDEAFVEDALSLDDALAASERYLLRPEGNGYSARLFEGAPDERVQLVSLHELWHLFEVQIQRGVPIRFGA